MRNQVMRWKSWELDFSKKTFVMGILNVTPDSFSDGGRYSEVERAVVQAEKLVEDGADIIDIGGESTRPGATFVEAEEEQRRILPVLEALRGRIGVPVSVDTYKASTAEAALRAGADIINDVWGAKADPDMARIAAEYDVPIILMHNRDNTEYEDLMPDMIQDVYESIAICDRAGVKADRIILDPGIGFAKTYEQNLEAMRKMDQFTSLSYPVLLGSSRKSLISKTLELPAHDRVEGTGATVSLGIERGCDIVRVHEVKEMTRVARMMDAMLGVRKEHSVG
ncbi:dihydropteroate synthase [Marinococcus halophilus]|uniref:Dihydropteroate synthase n=1 Tax=Marinococcus halophilus TaxID=1371 RepID=A0A510Y8W0_MARHA|nr:dihydropteroate synthase [Marinococcus halophilus]OZT79243.1 dihydropteroate synthase [Marinococcus halophilus]GEK59810.1 dihydropteroate synthase [Marinococcus halophilus]